MYLSTKQGVNSILLISNPLDQFHKQIYQFEFQFWNWPSIPIPEMNWPHPISGQLWNGIRSRRLKIGENTKRENKLCNKILVANNVIANF